MASRARLTALTLLWLLPLLLFDATPGAAQPTVIQIRSMSVRHEFPTSITFELDASTSGPATFTTVELYWHATADPAVPLQEPEFQPTGRLAIEYTVDMTTNYLPPGAEVGYFWRLEDSAGNRITSDEVSFQYQDQRFDWRQTTAGIVTIHWYSGDLDFGTAVRDSATETLARLTDQFQIELDNPVQIIVYGNDHDFSGALPPNSADWIGGVAYTDFNLIFAQITPGAGGAGEIQRLIPHEVTHLAVNQATENPYNSPPNWLDEGLATFAQETEDRRLRNALDQAIRDGRLIPVRALNSAFPLDDRQALLSYAESWSLIQFIAETRGVQAVADLLAVFKEEVSYEEAVQRTLGLTYEELDSDWKAWLDYAGDDPNAMAAFANEEDANSNSAVLIAAGVSMLLVCLLLAAFTTTVGYLLLGRRTAAE